MKEQDEPDRGPLPRIRTFRDIIGWQKGMGLSVAVYPLALRLPDVERFALASQIRRSACSVPLNVAEGYGTGSRPGFLKHLRIARGSLAELDTALQLGHRLWSLILPPSVIGLLQETDRVIQALIRSVENSPKAPPGMSDA